MIQKKTSRPTLKPSRYRYLLLNMVKWRSIIYSNINSCGRRCTISHFEVMELLYYFLLLLTFLLFLLKLISFGYLSRSKSSAEKLPPGPWKLPIIGSMHHLRGSRGYPLHHSLKQLANRYGPIIHLQLGEISTIVVSSPSAAKEIMKTHDNIFASRPMTLFREVALYGGGLGVVFAPYGENWRQMRKICILELLSVKRVQSFQSIREEEVSEFVDDIFSSRTTLINITKKFYALTNDISARALFGKKCKDQNKFLMAVEEAVELSAASSVADYFPSSKLVCILSGIQLKLKRCRDDLDNILDSIVNEHKENNTFAKKTGEKEDLIDVLLRLQDHGDPACTFTTDNIKALIFDVFSAGTETSATTMEWVMSELMRNPKVMQRAQAEVRKVLSVKGKVTEDDIGELNYLELVIKETMRLHPPIPLLVPRESMKTCEIQGYQIPEKTRVIVNAWAIGRDPQHWDDAESFLPERFDGNSIDFKGTNFKYIPFGAGRRVCPGISFAMATIKLSLAHLLYSFDWELPHGTRPNDLDMAEASGIASSRKTNLHLLAIPRIPFAT